MASALNKTTWTSASVEDFLAAVENPRRRADAQELAVIMAEVTGQPAEMFGPSIVGFGRYHYRYASGREGDAPAAGFSPRTSALTIYIDSGVDEVAELLPLLGPHTVSKACLYVKNLANVDRNVLVDIIRRGYESALRLDSST